MVFTAAHEMQIYTVYKNSEVTAIAIQYVIAQSSLRNQFTGGNLDVISFKIILSLRVNNYCTDVFGLCAL